MADGSSSLKLHSSLSNALAMRDLMANWNVDFGKLADKSLAKLWYANVMAAVNSCGSVTPRILETKKDELDALAIEVSKEIVEEINEQVLGERMLKLWSTEKDINELEKKVEEENKKLENRRSTMHVKNASDNDAAAGLFPSIQRRVISLINSRACAMHLSLKKAIASHVDLMVKDRLLKVGDVGSLWLEICRLLFLPHPKLIVGDGDGMNPALRRQAAHKIRAAMIGDVLRKEDTVEAYAMRLLRYSEQLETVGRSVDDEELQTQLYAQLVMQQRYVEDYDKAESEALSKGESVTFDYLWRSVHNRVTMRLMMGLSVDRITGNGSLRGGDIAAAMDDGRWKPSNSVHPSKRYNDDRVCYRCKNPGHIMKDCPEPGKKVFKCNRCGEEGHTPSNCEAELEKVKAFKDLKKKRGENNNSDSNNDGGKKTDRKKVPAFDGSNFINVRIAKVGEDSDDDQ